LSPKRCGEVDREDFGAAGVKRRVLEERPEVPWMWGERVGGYMRSQIEANHSVGISSARTGIEFCVPLAFSLLSQLSTFSLSIHNWDISIETACNLSPQVNVSFVDRSIFTTMTV